MSLDFRTAVLNSFILFSVCTVLLGFLWRNNRDTYDGLGSFFVGFLLMFLGLGLIFLRGIIGNFISVVVANSLILLGFIPGLVGLKKFLGFPFSYHKNLWAWTFITSLLIYFTYLDPSVTKRIISFSALVVYFSCQFIRISIVDVDKASRKTTLGVGLVFVGYMILSLIRIICTIFFNLPGEPLDLPSNTAEVFFGYTQQALIVMWAYSLNFMLNKRLMLDLEREKVKFSSIFNNSPQGMVLSRLTDGKIVDSNPEFSKITGISSHKLAGRNTVDLGFWSSTKKRDQIVTEIQDKGSIRDVDIKMKHSSGEDILVSLSADLVSVSENSFLISTIKDITDKRNREQEIAKMALTDPLTGLLNKVAFSDKLHQAMFRASETGEKLYLIFLDLDRFKPVNDQFGHVLGDVVLFEAARRMVEAVGDEGVVARIGGDEFVIILSSQKSDLAFKIGEKIRFSLENPFDVEGQLIEISCSVGIATYPDHGTEAIELAKNADKAMYMVKKTGGNGVKLFE